MEEEIKVEDLKCVVTELVDNTTKKPYAKFTDKIIAVSKGGQTVILEPEDLEELEKVVGAKFKI